MDILSVVDTVSWMSVLDREPLDASQAKDLVRAILEDGELVFSSHALDEMDKDNLVEQDGQNVLWAGKAHAGEYENGSYRYRFSTPRMVFVVAFWSEDSAVVVTAWRIKP